MALLLDDLTGHCTLGEAMRVLGIANRRTLDKWLERLKIMAPVHPYDQRFRLLTHDEVELVRRARALMPLTQTRRPAAPPTVAIAATLPMAEPAADQFRGAAKLIPAQAGGALATHKLIHEYVLPQGLTLARHAAKVHGVPWRTVARYIQQGRIPVLPPRQFQYTNGVWLTFVLDAAGLAAFYEVCTTAWHGKAGFRRCPDCPHGDVAH